MIINSGGEDLDIEKSINYAISSLRTDLKYDLMYEGEEIYTKVDMVSMLTELQTKIEKLDTYDIERTHGLIEDCYATTDINEVIQQKINEIRDNKDE